MLDILIKDGVIADGTGKPRFSGDVGIQDDRIVEVGRVTTPAKRTIRAHGRFVTPGFVDIHTHLDGQVSWDSLLAPSCFHGVTSIAMGNCGVGFAPAKQDKHNFLISLLEGVEDIPGTALAEGLTWNWESFPQYLDAIAQRHYTLDVGAQLPHASLRTYVMGERGADHTQHPSDTELEQMGRLTREALEAGALGFSTSRSFIHRTRAGVNIGTWQATQRELTAIAQALRDAGKGVFQLISDAYQTADDAFVRSELELIRTLAKTSGRKLSFTVTQYDEYPARWKTLFAAIKDMVAEGLAVKAQVAPRPVGALLSFASSLNPFMGTATYRGLQSLPLAERVARLRQADVRARILDEHRTATYSSFAMLMQSYDRMFPLGKPVNYEPPPSASMAAEAKKRGQTADDYTYDVLLEEDGRRILYLPAVNYAHNNLDDVFAMMSDSNALYGLSDAGAHCASICDGSFPTTALALWGKGSRDGHKLPIEFLVHGYSQRNAAHVGWLDRGVVAPGYLADVNVIDLDKLDVTVPELVPDLPAGGERYLQGATGYCWTIKRGQVTFENAAPTGVLPGRLQRGAQAAP